MKEKKLYNDNIANARLKNVLKKDKQINPTYMKEVIKSDFFYLINNYFEVDFSSVNTEINVDDENNYSINIKCTGNRLKLMRTIPNE